MKSIMVLVHDDAGQEARLQVALDLTRALRGHLTCIDVAIAPVLMDDYMAPGGGMLLMREERAAEARNRHRLEARLAHEDVPWSWVDAAGDLGDAVTRAARLGDLVVISAKLPDFAVHDMDALPATLLRHGDRPIFAVPEHAIGLDVAGKALIAWDGSAEAEAALRAAVPILRLATSAMLLAVDDGSIAIPASEAASYLSRYDIKTAVGTVPIGGDSVGAVLLREIDAQAVDYVVMGGFSRGRLGQALFGSVARRMLAESPVPILLGR